MFWPLFSARGLELKLDRCEAAHNREAVSAVVLKMLIVDMHQNTRAKSLHVNSCLEINLIPICKRISK